MAQGSFSVAGETYTWRNNPSSGKLDIFDADGEHVGQAPSADEAKKFVERETRKGTLAKAKLMNAEKMDKCIQAKLAAKLAKASEVYKGKTISVEDDSEGYIWVIKGYTSSAESFSNPGLAIKFAKKYIDAKF